MYHSKQRGFFVNKIYLSLLFSICFSFAFVAEALEFQRRGTSFLYSSWLESLRVTRGNVYEDGTASFAGMHLSQRGRVKFDNGNSFLIDLGVIFGQAQAGSSSSILGYVSERKNFFGGMITPYIPLRHSKTILFKLGPGLIYRSTKWLTEDPALTVRSGADLNVVVLGNVEFQLAERLYMEQTVGTLAFNGRAFWSFGIGYFW